MFRAKLQIRLVLHVVDSGDPDQSHYILASGWPDRVHVLSEYRDQRVAAAERSLLTLDQVLETFGVGVYQTVKENLGALAQARKV